MQVKILHIAWKCSKTWLPLPPSHPRPSQQSSNEQAMDRTQYRFFPLVCWIKFSQVIYLQPSKSLVLLSAKMIPAGWYLKVILKIITVAVHNLTSPLSHTPGSPDRRQHWVYLGSVDVFIFHKQSSPMLPSRRRNLQPTTRLSLSPYAIRKTVLYVLPPPQNGNSNVHSAFVSVRWKSL